MRELTGQKQSPPSREQIPAGGLEFLALLARLLRRPRRGDRRLPLLWLVRTPDTPDLMALLRRFLSQGQRRRVPHAVLDLAAQPAGVDVPALLRELHRQLSLEAFGAARLRFRHYPLADWLMHQSLAFGPDTEDGRATLVRRLRDRRGARTAGAPVPPGGDATAIVSQVLLWLIRRAVPGAVFRVAVSGRVPLVGRHYRWFMRQQYLAPRQSTTFLGFAERLTAGWRDGEQPDQVNKLLLHAFLEDLRQAYRRRLWRPADWRRTAYPVLLLDHVEPGTVGHVLVRLVNDVRNETGRNDPLLVVAAGDQPPPELPEPHPLDEADEAHDEWVEALPEMRRLRRAAAWLVVLRPDATETGPPPRGGVRPFAAPEPPWWSRRFLPAAVCLVLLVGAGAWVTTRWGPGCHPSVSGGRVSVQLVDGECVGYSDSAAQVFNNDPGQQRLRTIQERIFAQNRAAEEVWRRSDRRRPYLTLVYLGTLTGNRTRADEESYVSEREELEGMATAQYALLKESAGADGAALLRIVVANGGRQMRHADRAVAMLAELARDDPTVLGVVGLVDSRASTARALRDLNRIGLPVLAPTLSADRMDANSRLYLQISAPNDDQARMVEAYARQVLKVDEAHVYWTTGEGSSLAEDLYVQTLIEGLRQRFGTRITRLDEWRTGRRLTAECGYQGLLFYAGRWSEFDGFLRALRECGDNPPRHLVGDDSVNRYMANPGLRAAAPGNLPVTYVSKAALGTCAALRAAQDRRDEARASFLTWIQADDLLDPPRCRPERPEQVGERVSLAYDAAMMMIRAVESLAARLHHADHRQRWDPESINPIGVHAEVLRQNAGAGHRGVAGLIRYPPGLGRAGGEAALADAGRAGARGDRRAGGGLPVRHRRRAGPSPVRNRAAPGQLGLRRDLAGRRRERWVGGHASAYGQAVAAHRTARGHLDAARRALDPADQPIAPADLVARLARLGNTLATPTPLPGTPTCVRIGSAATPDGDFPALVPLGAGHHLVLDTDAGDPRVAGLLRAVLLRLLAAAQPGGVRVAVLAPADRDRPEPGPADRDRPEPGPAGRDRPEPGPDGRDAAGADPAWTGFAGPLRPLVDPGVLMPPATGAAEVDALLDTVQRHAGAVDPGRELLVVVAASVGGTAAARLAALTERGPAAAVCVLAAGWPATEPPPGSATPVRLAERYAHVGDPPGAPFSADGSGLAAPVLLDGDPPAAEVAALAERLSAPGNGVEVAALLPERRWAGSAAGGLRTVIGRAGPEPVAAALDRATPHWLVDGSAGRASFLLTVVHGLAARYAPAELQLHLLDVTGRAGFADLVPTAGDPSWLPHARTVGIGPDREYGVAVLRDLRRELRRRVAARKRHGVAAAADQPRIVAVVDGFEALLAGDDTLAREATDLLVELVRAGGPAGMHLVLAGPNPPGALPGRVVAALGRFALRVALPRDAVDDPPVGSALLSAPPGATRTVAGRPATGPVRLPDAQAAAGELARLRRELWQARPTGSRPPSFFAGDATVRVEEDATFVGLRPGGRRPLALVGRTVDVDGTSALFIMDAAPGRHLAVVGASATGAAVLRAATLSLARQHAPGDARFLLAPLAGATDSAAEDTAATLAAAGHPVVRLDAAGLRAHLGALAAIFPGAISSPPAGAGCGPAGALATSAPTGRTYLVVFGADVAHQVLATADPETGRTGHDDLRALLRHGPGHGAHLLGWWRGLGPLARDLGDAREPEDLACLVALDVPGDELGACLGLPDLWSPRPGRALLVDRHDQRTRLIVPFTGRELDGEG